MATHDERVAVVSAAVKSFFDAQKPFRIQHGSTNTTRTRHSEPVVDISSLSNILYVDKRLAIVEPNVPMDKLLRATLPHNSMPPVVPEFPGITVGGAYAGSAGESSSFKYGYFNTAIQEIEMVLANGNTVTASKVKNSELLKGASGALGTLGVVTKLTLNLISAKPLVKLSYHTYTTIGETVEAIEAATKDPANDFVDGILFTPTHGVMMTGQLTNHNLSLDQKPITFSGPRDPWFYLHAEQKFGTTPSTDYIPLAEYLFRYDRGGFWVGKDLFDIPFLPFNRFTRWLLDDFLHTRMLFKALHSRSHAQQNLIHDLALPYATVQDFIAYNEEHLDVWPLWLCPLRSIQGPTFHPFAVSPQDPQFSINNATNRATPLPMLNIGLWGPTFADTALSIFQNRHLERVLASLNGRKVLYSNVYYSEDNFWRLYDREWYERLRERWGASTLPTVYEKVKVDLIRRVERPSWVRTAVAKVAGKVMGPFRVVRRIWGMVRSEEFTAHRERSWMSWGLDLDETAESVYSGTDQRLSDTEEEQFGV